MAWRRAALIASLAALLAACATPPPHIDRDGRALAGYDPQRSFFPIGLYHALHGRHYGRDFDLRDIAALGFNFVHPWEGQRDLRGFLDAAGEAGLKVFPAIPNLDAARPLAGHKALLAWYVVEDPLYLARTPERALDDLPRVRALMRDLESLEPGRLSSVVETSTIVPPWREAWLAWARAAPLHALYIYPIVEDPGVEARRARISFRRGIPETIAASLEAAGRRRPVWLIVQAFASPFHWPVQRWLMPTPEEMRAMAYAGLVAGATGLLYFAMDSFVTRAGLVVGMGPDIPESHGPTPDYGGTGKPPIDATPEERAAGQLLWAAMPRLNAEVAALAPALLSPDARTPFAWFARGQGTLAEPIRAILKRHPDGGSVLIAVNHERAPAEVRFVFERAPPSFAALTPDSPDLDAAGTNLVALFPPFGVGVWRLPRTP